MVMLVIIQEIKKYATALFNNIRSPKQNHSTNEITAFSVHLLNIRYDSSYFYIQVIMPTWTSKCLNLTRNKNHYGPFPFMPFSSIHGRVPSNFRHAKSIQSVFQCSSLRTQAFFVKGPYIVRLTILCCLCGLCKFRLKSASYKPHLYTSDPHEPLDTIVIQHANF